ncbi:MAG: hypothetical protein IPM02_25785 [Betaproteobacteria bacterium]|nr:hypothetical protein [Betaproteobacteria bacterium]
MLFQVERLPPIVRRLGRAVSALEKSVLAVCLFLIIASVVWGVLTRYVSRVPAPWTGELASISFCWLTMVGASWLYSAHPRLFDPGKLAAHHHWPVATIPTFALEVIVLVFVLVYAIRQSLVNFDNATSILQVPTSVYYFPIVWFALASLVRAAFRKG